MANGVNALALRGRVPAVGSLSVGEFNPAAGQNALIAGQREARASRLDDLRISEAERARDEAILDDLTANVLGATSEADFNTRRDAFARRRGIDPNTLSQITFAQLPALRAEAEGASNIIKAQRLQSQGGFTGPRLERFNALRRAGVPESQANLIVGGGVRPEDLPFTVTPPTGQAPQVAQAGTGRQPARPAATPELSPQDLASRRRVAATLTPGERKLDERFSETVREFSAAGGSADIEKSLEQLEGVATQLEGGAELTGAFTGPLSRVPVAGPLFAGGAIGAREAVEEVVQRNLRAVLGGQFAQQEAEQLISRAFNPNLDEPENARRLRRLITQIRTAAQETDRAVRYFQQFGTLRGFQGRVPSFSDFNVTGGAGEGGEDQPRGATEAAPRRRGLLEGPGPQPSALAVSRLRGAPTDANIEAFNRQFGDGAAERVLGVQ